MISLVTKSGRAAPFLESGRAGLFSGRPDHAALFSGRPDHAALFGGRPDRAALFGGRPDRAAQFGVVRRPDHAVVGSRDLAWVSHGSASHGSASQ